MFSLGSPIIQFDNISLRMSASVHETLVPQKSIMSVSAHETQVQSELQPYFISSQLRMHCISIVAETQRCLDKEPLHRNHSIDCRTPLRQHRQHPKRMVVVSVSLFRSRAMEFRWALRREDQHPLQLAHRVDPRVFSTVGAGIFEERRFEECDLPFLWNLMY